MRTISFLFLALSIAVVSGCSFSNSSGSISDSISSPSESISNSSKSSSGSSSGGDEDDKAAEPEAPKETANYEADVSQLTVTYAKSGGEIGAFRSAVSRLAMDRGITNWEVDSKTNRAIGRGAGTAGMQEESFTAFSQQLFGNDLNKLNDLRKGYQQTAPPQREPLSQSEGQPEDQTESQPESTGQAEPETS